MASTADASTADEQEWQQLLSEIFSETHDTSQNLLSPDFDFSDIINGPLILGDRVDAKYAHAAQQESMSCEKATLNNPERLSDTEKSDEANQLSSHLSWCELIATVQKLQKEYISFTSLYKG
jgi:hypothetical protein